MEICLRQVWGPNDPRCPRFCWGAKKQSQKSCEKLEVMFQNPIDVFVFLGAADVVLSVSLVMFQKMLGVSTHGGLVGD